MIVKSSGGLVWCFFCAHIHSFRSVCALSAGAPPVMYVFVGLRSHLTIDISTINPSYAMLCCFWTNLRKEGESPTARPGRSSTRIWIWGVQPSCEKPTMCRSRETIGHRFTMFVPLRVDLWWREWMQCWLVGRSPPKNGQVFHLQSIRLFAQMSVMYVHDVLNDYGWV